MKVKKTIYYDDPLNDDFAGGSFHYKPLPKNYRFFRWNPIYWVFQEMIYYVIAIPILWLVGKIFWGYRVVGRRKLKRAHIGAKGYFLYGNHTTKADAIFAPVSICNPRHAFLITADNAMSHRILLPLIRLLGAIPLPSYPEQREAFVDCIKRRYKRGNAIIIFPEAHIWPYCTRIRPFPDQSFTYPAQLNAPVFAMCTTYEEHKIFKFLKPRPVVHVSDPIYPDMSKALGERTHLLREAVYRYMEETSASLDNVEYWRYLPRPKEENKEDDAPEK